MMFCSIMLSTIAVLCFAFVFGYKLAEKEDIAARTDR